MSQSDEHLSTISEQLQKGVKPSSETVRSFLLWFDAERRGDRVIRQIRKALEKHGLITAPDFEWAYIGDTITFEKLSGEKQPHELNTNKCAIDPTYRIDRLPSAHRKPVFVRPDSEIKKVITVMLSNDFSQLPVMTSQRDVKGVVSWKSIGNRLALNRPCKNAKECMEEPHLVKLEESLFSAIRTIAIHDYVLVRGQNRIICGIVTPTDFNEQFKILAEPFLLVGEIENGVRQMLYGKFTARQLRKAKAPADDNRIIDAPSDLTFGEYIRLIEDERNWKKLELEIDRVEFVKQLRKVRDVRNDVMHFNPDGLETKDLNFLRGFARFLKELRDCGAI